MTLEHDTTLKWRHDALRFDANLNGHSFLIDSEPEHGGLNMGPPPKPLVLTSLGGCTGMDAIAILRKMETLPEDLTVEVHGKLREAHPRIYKEIHVVFKVKGDVPKENMRKAVSLSKDRFCGVSAMLRETSDITYEIEYENGDRETVD